MKDNVSMSINRENHSKTNGILNEVCSIKKSFGDSSIFEEKVSRNVYVANLAKVLLEHERLYVIVLAILMQYIREAVQVDGCTIQFGFADAIDRIYVYSCIPIERIGTGGQCCVF